MEPNIQTPKSENFYHMKPIKILLLFSLFLLISAKSLGQTPIWQNGRPIVTPKPITLELEVDLDRACNVYYSVFP